MPLTTQKLFKALEDGKFIKKNGDGTIYKLQDGVLLSSPLGGPIALVPSTASFSSFLTNDWEVYNEEDDTLKPISVKFGLKFGYLKPKIGGDNFNNIITWIENQTKP